MGCISGLVRTMGKSFLMAMSLALLLDAQLWAATVNVTVATKDANGQLTPITTGYRWMLEEDATFPNIPGSPFPLGPRDPNSLSYTFFKSYMPVAAKGDIGVGGGGVASIPNVDPAKRYYLSVLPHRPAGSDCQDPSQPKCYSMSGTQVAFPAGGGPANVTVVVTAQPIPSAQISVFAFEDNNPINSAPDLPQEAGLGGFSVLIIDQGGQLLTDVYGNPLGTTYSGLDPAGQPILQTQGTGIILTMTQADVNNPATNPHGLKVGEALIKNLAPGKYGVQIVPPTGQGWQQVTTIEGNKTIDAWVKPNEPRYLVEFGPSFPHVFMGFVKQFNTIPAPGAGQLTGTIEGTVVNGHLGRPPELTFSDGHLWPNCWVGLNLGARGHYAAPCNADSTFSIPNVPSGNWQLVIWDEFLDNIIGFRTAVVPPTGGTVNLGKVQVLAWFARQDHYVFNDVNQNGQRDPGEAGIPEQAVNLRNRDGTIYQSFPTDAEGYVPFDEVFPFFHWQVAEVDFLRFKATGVTVYVDAGGGPVDTTTTEAPGWGKLNPQLQPDNNGLPSRTETGLILLEAYQGFQGTTNVFEWGKANYAFGENGGISGIVHYATTRAENDPQLAVGDPWEPGIPRVQVNLYERAVNSPGVIRDVNGGGIQLADVDNYPFGWKTGGPMGPEDVKRNNLATPTTFSAGDAVHVVTSDSWDDSLPTGCVNPLSDSFYGPPLPQDACHDGYRNYNQVRPGVFDGGYAFNSMVTGGASSDGQVVEPIPAGFYIVEAVAPKGYDHQTEESKNVDFGDTTTLSPLVLPPACVNNDAPQHVVPAELTLFPGIEAPNFGATTPLCDRKEIYLANGSNPGVNFFLYTDVPASAHVTGQVTSDITNELDPISTLVGEKFAPAFIPMSFQDWTGHELARVHTNEWGRYNVLLPSTYNINAPHPSGVGPGMYHVCMNHPGPIKDPNNPNGPMIIDPFYNKQFNHLCLTFQFEPGRTIVLDTPILPTAAFVGSRHWQLDCNCPDRSPRIHSVSAAANGIGGGPVVVAGNSRQLTITSLGTVQVTDPNGVNNSGAPKINRDFGFGNQGQVTIVTANGSVVSLQNVAWSNDVITGDVPNTLPNNATTGQLVVRRSDSGLSTVNSVTVHLVGSGAGVTTVAAGTTIQAAVDAAAAGGLVLVPPGTYSESLVITKPVRLQGWGAGSTVIDALKVPTEKIQLWHELVNQRVNCLGQIDLLPGQPNNQQLAAGVSPSTCNRVVRSGLFGSEEGAAILVAPKSNSFSNTVPSRIDGFTVTGSSQGGGIIISAYARFLEISNNLVTNNLGLAGGGIRLGHPGLLSPQNQTLYVSAQNTNVKIHHNHVSENASVGGVGVIASFPIPGGGIAIYNGSDAYSVTDNFICGNLSLTDGGGLAHFGRSDDGVIANNKIVFNQAFNEMPGRGSGAGILVSGLAQPAGATLPQTQGSGDVLINGNLIQGNGSGSGDGAGVMLRQINGQDVLAQPTNNSTWYRVDMTNNIIVNNSAGATGGGIALQDAARTRIINNTIAHNESTATANIAFGGLDPNVSTPQPAGVVSNIHSAELLAALDPPGAAVTTFPTFSQPTLTNNIILNNRSFHYNTGVLVFDGANDLAVLPLGSLCGVALAPCRLNPRSSILSTTTLGYHSSNVLVDETQTPMFSNAYYNAPPQAPYLGTINPINGTFNQPNITVVPRAAAAQDEGGNFIQTFYGPLSVVGNYHLVNGAPAVDRGTNGVLASIATLARDYDNDVRPQGSAADIGADETAGAASAILSFIVRRADTNTVIVNPLTNGANLDLFALCGSNCPVTIEAVTSVAPIESVRLVLTGATAQNRDDNSNPYTIPGTAGMILNTGAHVLTATPFSGNDAGGTAGTALTVNFTVSRAPVINTTAGTTATLGNLYFYDVNATSAAGPLVYTLMQLPAANRGVMTINTSNGQISWTPAIPSLPTNANPTVAYNQPVTVRVTDSQGRFTEQTFTIAVSPKAETIVVNQAIFNNPAGNGNLDATWTVSGTSNVDADNCTGTPNVCGNLTIFRMNAVGGGSAVIGTATVNPTTGVWSFTTGPPPGTTAVTPDSLRVRSLTGGVVNSAITFN